jgi:DNA-binding PadR family transcriptional regulator
MENAQKNQIGAMEMFLLGMMAKAKVRTLYDLQRRARLSSGAAVPALRRLEGRELIASQIAKGSRKRRFRLTSEGRDVLKKTWPSSLEKIPLDIDGILRCAWIAVLMGDPGFGAKYLRKAAQKKEEAAELERRTAQGNSGTYVGFAAEVSSKLLECEARALNEIAAQLEPCGSNSRTPTWRPAVRIVI